MFLSFLKECEDLRIRLEKEVGKKEALYADLISMIIRVSDHLLEEHKAVKKGLKDIMGGKVLELSSEKLIKKGRAEKESEITYNIKNNLKKQHPDWDEARIEAETEMLIKAI